MSRAISHLTYQMAEIRTCTPYLHTSLKTSLIETKFRLKKNSVTKEALIKDTNRIMPSNQHA